VSADTPSRAAAVVDDVPSRYDPPRSVRHGTAPADVTPAAAPRRIAASTGGPATIDGPPGAPTLAGPPMQGGAELDRSFARGLAWTAGAKWLTQLLSWGVTIAVAKLLSPSDYGLVGMAAIVLGLVSMVSEFGIGTAIVTLRDLDDEDVAQVNGFALVLGVACFAFGCLVALPLARFFDAPALPLVIVVQSTGFVLSAFQSVPSALLQRDLRFRVLAGVDVARSAVAASTALALAAMGAGYWALVLGELVASAAQTVMYLALRRHRIAVPRRARLARVLVFSGRMLVGRLSWYVYSNADFAIAGRRLGQAALGAYSFAWTLTTMPTEKLTALVSRVSPAFFAAVQHDRAALRRYLLLLTEGLAVLTLPACVGIALVADQFLPLVFGAKWNGAIVPLQLLTLSMAMRAIITVVPNALLALGEARFLMYHGIGCAVTFPIAFLLGVRWGGIAGLAAAWLVVYPLSTVPLLWRAFTRLVRPGEYLRAIAPALQGVVVMTLAVLGVSTLMPARTPTLAAAGVVLQIVAGAAAYAGVLWLGHRERMLRLLGALRAARR
jgi:PST family polysaccharide transporter